MIPPILEGLLVDLIPFGTAFWDRMHDWENGEAEYWASVGDRPFVSHQTLQRHQREQAERPLETHHTRLRFGIRTKDGKLLGIISFNWISPHNRLGMLGAAIGEPDYWGGGYGTDALLLIVDYGFEWMDLRKIWLGTMSLNVRVQRQMEKVGFTLEARRRESYLADGQRVDELTYGLQREDWPGRLAVIERLGLTAR